MSPRISHTFASHPASRVLLLLAATSSPALALPAASPPPTAPSASETPVSSAPGASVVEDLPQTSHVYEFNADFDSALAHHTDLLLEGVDAEARVDFTVPAEWDLVDEPVLVLELAHSAALLPERSHLTVKLGEQTLASVRLDGDNGHAGRLVVPLPRELLQEYNHLSLRAVQHYGDSCEDPFDPGLWTRIRNSSHIAMRYRRRAVEPELAALPYPLFDATGYGPMALTLVLPPTPSRGAVEAIGRLGVAFGRYADYRGVTVDGVVPSVRAARTHALLVGLWSDTPEIRALVGEPAPHAGEGLVALAPNPADPSHAVLVVTGIDAEGLAKATRAVTGQTRYGLLSGARALVTVASDGRPPPSRREPHAAPAAARFPLSALGFSDQTVRGFYTAALDVPLALEGNAVVRPNSGEATIRYSYAASLDPKLSAMEVRLDGVTLKSVALDHADGETHAEVRVPLPDRAITPRSALEVAFTLFPRDFDPCAYTSDATLWATVHADSELDLPRDGVAELPDLGRLRWEMWPLTLEPGAGAVTAALPDRPGADDVAAGFLLGAALGRTSHAEDPSFLLVPSVGLDFGSLADQNVVMLATGAPHALYDILSRDGALSVSGSAMRTARAGNAAKLTVAVSDGDAVVEELVHPVNPLRAALVLTPTKGMGGQALVRAVTNPANAGMLAGNVVLVGRDGEMRSLDLAERHEVGERPLHVAMSTAARKHWLALGMALLGAAGGVAALKRAWVRARGS